MGRGRARRNVDDAWYAAQQGVVARALGYEVCALTLRPHAGCPGRCVVAGRMAGVDAAMLAAAGSVALHELAGLRGVLTIEQRRAVTTARTLLAPYEREVEELARALLQARTLEGAALAWGLGRVRPVVDGAGSAQGEGGAGGG